MGWVTGIVVYFLVWWITLFAVLPLWVTPADPDDPGQRKPENCRLGRFRYAYHRFRALGAKCRRPRNYRQ